jgi:formate dehydrogenase subunit gamma
MATQVERVLPNRRILRYTYAERIMHWIAGLSYVYLLLTGLAFWSPRLYWIAYVLGGGQTIRMLHPWAGLVFTASVIWMWFEWRRDMQTTPDDLRWKETFGHYVRNQDDQVAGAGRFNYGQKQFFWIMFWGGLALLFSGLVMWFTSAVPWSLHWLRYLAILVHLIGGGLTIGAFIIHVYMGTAVVREGFSSVIRGEVSESWARTHHPLWLKEISGQSKK